VVRGSLELGAGAQSATAWQRRPPDHQEAGRRRSGDGRILLGRIIVSGFVVDRPQLVGHRLIRQ